MQSVIRTSLEDDGGVIFTTFLSSGLKDKQEKEREGIILMMTCMLYVMSLLYCFRMMCSGCVDYCRKPNCLSGTFYISCRPPSHEAS